MRLLRGILTAIGGGMRSPMEAAPTDHTEESAWQEYHSAWEFDPPPDPRSVFLAGLRAGRSIGADGTVKSAPAAEMRHRQHPGEP